VGDMPNKPHRMRDARGLGQFLEALPVITVADNEVCDIRDTPENPRQDADHSVMPLIAL
jgi:hypothetical protein